MNRDDIIRMAREAGFTPTDTIDGAQAVYAYMRGITAELERFANLVAAEERKHCYDLIETLVKAEREACAQVCESHAAEWRHLGGLVGPTSEDIAVRIRARGEK